MTIDVTSNSQYIALKQSYDKQIDRDQQIEQGLDDLKSMTTKMSTLDPHSKEYHDLDVSMKSTTDKLEKLDPGGAIRGKIVAGTESAEQLTQQETEALSTLATVLDGQEAVKAANAAGAQAAGIGEEPDVMTKLMLTFALLGQATDTVTQSYMDDISANVKSVTELSKYSQTVRSARPDGTDSNATAKVSADVIDALKGLNVEIPAGATKNSDGTYTLKQSDFDTLINNIQSESSSLTTLNQNKTIDLNKSIDVGQQCTTFQSADLDKWAQLMNKIAS